MKPILLFPIIAGMVLMPSSGLQQAPKPKTPADVYMRSYSVQMQDVRTHEPTATEIRAGKYAERYQQYDPHHEAVQVSGHSGIAAPKPTLGMIY